MTCTFPIPVSAVLRIAWPQRERMAATLNAFTALDIDEVQVELGKYLGRVVLVVNVASE